MLGCMRLRHGARTAAAGIFWATGHQHAQLRRDHVQPLAHVLADLCHLAAAARAQRALRLDNPFDPWQMSRQLTAIAIGRTRRTVGFALDERRRFLLGGIEHALGDLHIFQRQMELVRPQLLGFGAELLSAHVDDDCLQALPGLLRLGKRRLRLRQLLLQAFILIAENSDVHELFKHRPRVGAMRGAEPESLCRSDKLYPASCGRRLPSGRTRRQSNPSNKAANIAGDIRITPSRTCGHTNLQPSSRLCTSTMSRPVPDQNLHTISPFRAEHKGRPTERIKPEHLLHQRRKSIMTFTEVHRACRHVYLQIAARRNHRDARTARITRARCVGIRRPDHHVVHHHLDAGPVRLQLRLRLFNHQRRERPSATCCRQRQSSLPQPTPPIVNLPPRRAMLARDLGNLHPRHQALGRDPRLLRRSAAVPSDLREPRADRRSRPSRRPNGRPFCRLLPRRPSAQIEACRRTLRS